MNVTLPDDLPTLTVIIVVRNGERTIARTLDSLVAQHYPKLEVVVWDGVSSDATLEILARYKSLITVLKSESDKGPPDARNRTLKLATGDFVGFLSADDVYEPGALWAVADAVRANTGSDVISFGILYRKPDGQGNGKVIGYYADERQLQLTLEYVLNELPSFEISRFFRRGLLEAAGLYNPDWRIANDRDLMARLALMNCKNVIIPRALYGFDLHDAGLSSNPHNFSLSVKEHVAIAAILLKRTDLSAPQRRTVEQWRLRQLAFGFWKALFNLDGGQAYSFMCEGIGFSPTWILVSPYQLTLKLAKRLGLLISGGIDRGNV